ncbi:MAG TPA: DUF790 family protein [Roseiflexaceae bacterium]|nr:DUF790 family protein [Roseiflexaceae bacterium]
MAFSLSDFKKTTRRGDEGRQLYPYQIRDGRYTAAIGYAIAYYERMVGRRRGEFESDTLLEFFGDPRLARGLVACLGRTYAWRTPQLREALGEQAARVLARAGVETPADLRARWYRLANERYGGCILPHERAQALDELCERLAGDGPTTNEQRPTPNDRPTTSDQQPATDRRPASDASGSQTTGQPRARRERGEAEHEIVRRSSLVVRLSPAQLEEALVLDAEERQVLVKLGPTPEAEEIVARYNYHSLETALCHAELLRLQLRGPVWSIIRSAHGLARRYRLRYEVSGAPRSLFDERLELTLYGGRDALGRWTRAGRRLVRALLRLLASHPGCLASGAARVHLRGEALLLRLDERALAVLGVGAQYEPQAQEPWDEDGAEALRRAWGRAYVAGHTAGWRLRRDPEPLVGAAGEQGARSAPLLVVPDFALVRGGERLALCMAGGPATAQALLRDLGRLGRRSGALAVVPAHVAEGLRSCPVPLATYEEQPGEAVPQLVAALQRAYPRRASDAPTPWQRLERMVAEEGFVPEETAAALLGCAPHELAQTVQRWGGAGLHALPGVGVCAPELVGEIKELLAEGAFALRAA